MFAKRLNLLQLTPQSVWIAGAALVLLQQPVQSKRIVSFAPSNTELLYSIGADDELIGVCSFCDYPIDVKSRNKVGTFVSANLERLARLKPDTILLVSGQEAMAGMLRHHGYNTKILSNNKLRDISNNLRQLGALLGQSDEATRLADNYDQCLADLAKITGSAKSRPKVFYCVWPQPLLTVGQASFLTDVITICGGISVSASLPPAYPHFSAEKLLLSDPDIVIMPYDAKAQNLLTRTPWSTLKAVKNHQCFILPQPAQDGLSRPTLRVMDGLLWLSKRMHPELCQELDDWMSSHRQKLQRQQVSRRINSK